jgi:hypothetical protein
MPVHRNKSAQKNTTPMVAKLDESVEIRPESPDVNLEIGLDISVVRNNSEDFRDSRPVASSGWVVSA